MNIIDTNFLLKMYKKGYFPMAKNSKKENVNFYKPYKRFLLPILAFHIPKKLLRDFKKKNIFSKLIPTFIQ